MSPALVDAGLTHGGSSLSAFPRIALSANGCTVEAAKPLTCCCCYERSELIVETNHSEDYMANTQGTVPLLFRKASNTKKVKKSKPKSKKKVKDTDKDGD